jgi:hypothetical protein
MCHFGMAGLGDKAPGRQISYIFELGDSGQKGLIKFLDFIEEKRAAERFLDLYSLSHKTVTRKDGMEGIYHSADFVAWEWSKHVERHLRGKPMRQSLSDLFGANHQFGPDKYGLTLSNGEGFFCRHFSPERISRSLGFFKASIEADNEDRIRTAFNEWDAVR